MQVYLECLVAVAFATLGVIASSGKFMPIYSSGEAPIK
jgi:hypothetical protein